MSLKKYVCIGMATLILTGCATKVVSSNPRSVVVESQAMNAGKAQGEADAECAKHGLYAKMTSKADYWDRNYVFECVE